MQTLAKAPANKLSFGQYIQTPTVSKLISETLGDKEVARKFVASITSAVAQTPALKNCTPATIVSSALVGEALKLSPSPVMGQYYLVPFKNKGVDQAQFILGYRGMVTLAIRSGQYRDLNVEVVKDGELLSYDPFNGKYTLKPITNPTERKKAKTTGYFASFTLINGFHKELYMSKDEMEIYANTYSKAYQRRTGNTFWEKDFDAMAKKTMLRQLLSKWGIMSIDMQTAYESDMAVINEDGSKDYVDGIDNDEVIDITPTDEPKAEVVQPSEVKYPTDGLNEPPTGTVTEDATEYDDSLI